MSVMPSPSITGIAKQPIENVAHLLTATERTAQDEQESNSTFWLTVGIHDLNLTH